VKKGTGYFSGSATAVERSARAIGKVACPLFLLAACGAGPDDLFIVSGRTVTRDGEPLSGVRISADRQRGCRESLSTPLRDTRSGDGGSFSFDFIRVEVSSLSEDVALCTRVKAHFPSGAEVWTTTGFLPYRLQLPDWNDWTASLSLDDGGVPRFDRVLDEGGLTECRGSFPDREVVEHGLTARAASGTAWEVTDHVLQRSVPDGGVSPLTTYVKVPISLPPEALEDFAVDVSAEARRIGCVEVIGSDSLGAPGPYQLVTRWSSPGSVPLRGQLTPASRGATCDDLQEPCFLTDGDLEPRLFDPMRQTFTLRLQRPARVRAIALRGGLMDISFVPEEISVRAGSDAMRLRPDGGTPDALDDIVILPSGALARRAFRLYVLDRPLAASSVIELEAQPAFYGLAEISLFE